MARRRRAGDSGTTDESPKHQRISSCTAVLGVFLSVPALVISVITYIDQQDSEEKSGLEAASKVFWYVEGGTADEASPSITVENRSLMPAYHVAILLKDDTGHDKYLYDFTVLRACTKESYDISKHPEALSDINNSRASLIFFDSIGRLWRNTMNSSGASLTRGVGEPIHVRAGDVSAKWKLPQKRKELDNCG
ncbi:hypothetical protein [Streptomyces sp. NPDC001657]|uniref:hypothetical protein n=1 Tax=Streptomyces sp. NPDC001657 TaxID=3154522 RepID=UPI00331BFEE0